MVTDQELKVKKKKKMIPTYGSGPSRAGLSCIHAIGSALWIAGVDHPPSSLSDPTDQLECMCIEIED
jgi:hypothetical protein